MLPSAKLSLLESSVLEKAPGDEPRRSLIQRMCGGRRPDC